MKPRKKQGDGRTIRVSMDVYNKICELGKTNDSFTSVVERIFQLLESTNISYCVI